MLNKMYILCSLVQTKIANLLGVAGTDVPIRDIKKLLSPFLVRLFNNIILNNYKFYKP